MKKVIISEKDVMGDLDIPELAKKLKEQNGDGEFEIALTQKAADCFASVASRKNFLRHLKNNLAEASVMT